MASERGTSFFTLRPRRRPQNRLLDPALQLQLPLVVVAVTIAFAAVSASYGYVTFDRLFALALEDSPNPAFFTRVFEAQTADFLLVTLVITVAYALMVAAVSILYAHRMVGPMVPFRRHVQAIKDGDYSHRIHLRKGDAFTDFADELNELAEQMGEAEKPEQPAD